MRVMSNYGDQVILVDNFQDLVSTKFFGRRNAICWHRELRGDFAEIVAKIELTDNIVEVDVAHLQELDLTEQGKVARSTLINDLEILGEHGASPCLNVIKNYDKDDSFFSTDVYSFHVDRSHLPVDTYLCTYHGACSDILPNSQGIKKVLVPETREALKALFDGPDEEFESFLSEHFFDLHYQPISQAQPINLGIGQLWRLAIDHPESTVPPCIHRAPLERSGESRLLLIC